MEQQYAGQQYNKGNSYNEAEMISKARAVLDTKSILPLTILSSIEYDLLGESRYFMEQKRDLAESSSTTYTLHSRKHFELLDTSNIPLEYRASPPIPRPSARNLEPYKDLVSAALESSLPGTLPRLFKSASRPNIFDSPDNFSMAEAFRKGSDLEKCINTALDALHRADLSRKERIWTLAILDGLQASLPRGELQPMRTDILEGPVRRGAFELHLIRGQGIDLLPIAQRMCNPKALPSLPISLIEALQRAELLAAMQKAIKTKIVPRLSQSGRKLHDMLVQAALPLDKDQAVRFVSTFEEHWSRHLDLSLETRWAYDILNHMLRYDVNVRRYTEWRFTIDGFFKTNSQRFWASTVKADILRIIRKASNDPYITNILQPFKKDTPADFSHFKHVIDSFKVQNHAIHNFQEQQYGISPFKIQEYLEDQNIILGVLYKASAHNPHEVVPYLNSELDYKSSKDYLNLTIHERKTKRMNAPFACSIFWLDSEFFGCNVPNEKRTIFMNNVSG
ncbi:uncharacterized protein MELLADRAFT_100916 [Melampsora larici-populina 98AG31]|uniref:Uncharacterized protein n=1 Tax=Melampsora larici-populina (strain 98AG31 / pathotype 3-4-7) TaxID=747676 RepID=F4R304_MELLP|nr:uncharacterized protein MELLADRAFT_100916 [Melampsora larici-populina 98AG31]EGG12543.1 hypothetical protein MELLADRAFT_100916 [Melampsora larici-populina 98AG31]